jgi:predicted PhzF superfamily epimerase YddE/YHI9
MGLVLATAALSAALGVYWQHRLRPTEIALQGSYLPKYVRLVVRIDNALVYYWCKKGRVWGLACS